MMERRRFPAEQGQRGLVFGHVRQKHLDRHGSAGLDLVALVDFAHAPGADHLVYFVDTVKPRTGRYAAIGWTERIFGIHDRDSGLPSVMGDFVGSDERGADNKRTTTIVTLSRPPRSSAKSSITSQ